jgi:hypothetical protein
MASYSDISSMRAQGLSSSLYADGAVTTALALATQYIDRATRQWFESRTLTALLDGNDSDRLFLPVPVISVSGLWINNRFETQEALPTTDYAVYNGRGLPDDRKNPKIGLISQRRSIYQVPALQDGRRIFMKGHKNQKITGAFGYTESDGTTPLLIKRACEKMALRFVAQLAADGQAQDGSGSSGAVIGEMTDGHMIQYAMPASIGIPGATFGISKDAEVEQILQAYRAPVAIAVPGSAFFELG